MSTIIINKNSIFCKGKNKKLLKESIEPLMIDFAKKQMLMLEKIQAPENFISNKIIDFTPMTEYLNARNKIYKEISRVADKIIPIILKDEIIRNHYTRNGVINVKSALNIEILSIFNIDIELDKKTFELISKISEKFKPIK